MAAPHRADTGRGRLEELLELGSHGLVLRLPKAFGVHVKDRGISLSKHHRDQVQQHLNITGEGGGGGGTTA